MERVTLKCRPGYDSLDDSWVRVDVKRVDEGGEARGMS